MTHPNVKLREVLRRSEETIVLQPDATYNEITVRLWGKGVVPRGEVTGAEIASSRRFVARAGQLIVSRIDARNGAIGIVPTNLDGGVVTNDFPLFLPESTLIELSYLAWLTRTHAFVDLCRRASEGTTNRVRLQEQRFLDLEIPLPSVSEQRRLVARISELADQLDHAQRLLIEARSQSDMLWKSTVDAAFRGALVTGHRSSCAAEQLKAAGKRIALPSQTSHNNAHPDRPVLSDEGPFGLPTGWVWTTLGSVLTHLVDCVNDTPDFVDEDTGCLGLKSTNVRPYRLDQSRKWYVSATDFERWNRREAPISGDVLLTREAPVGFACVMPPDVKACLTQRLMLLRPYTEVIETMWLLHYLNGPHFRRQIEEHSRGLTTPHIRVQDAPNFLLPLPPLEAQHEILQTLNALQDSLRACSVLRDDADAGMEAMLPAVLDRAFAGEL